MPDFHTLPIWINAAVFAAAAGIVWFAGTRLAVYADILVERTKAGEAILGVVLLGGITSLPELAVSGTSAVAGNAELAVNNILGSVALQAALLAFADAAIGREALTSVIARPVVLLQATCAILILAFTAVGILVGDVPVLGVGAWTIGLFAFYVAAVWLINNAQSKLPWQPTNVTAHAANETDASDKPKTAAGRQSLSSLAVKIAGMAVLIIIAGYLLSHTGEGLADQTGLGASFERAVLVAIATSLPELSTVLSAVRLRRYEMAVSDIVGTNLFNVAIIFFVDLLYPGPPVLNQVGRFAAIGALLGIVITAFFLAGLIERRDRTVLRMGIDLLAVVVAYLGGVTILFFVR